jgi:hypothetical protein
MMIPDFDRVRLLVSAALGACLLAGCASAPGGSRAYSFGMMGDTQYSSYEERHFPAMIDAVNREDLKFVVHVGDFKAGSNSPCTDQLFLKRREEFNRSRHPFVYTPGDNDWTDCRRPTNGKGDPLERLEKLRELFYSEPRSIGQNPMPVTRESDVFRDDKALSRYRENLMWSVGGAVYLTVNIQGSNDNRGFDARNDAEHADRTRANIEWVKTAIARANAERAVGIVLFQQANPGFEEPLATAPNNGYAEFLTAFEREARAWGKPMLFAHGDTHTFRIDRPYKSPIDKRDVPNVTRVETYGSPFVNWLRITVDPDNPANPFTIRSGGFVPDPQPD